MAWLKLAKTFLIFLTIAISFSEATAGKICDQLKLPRTKCYEAGDELYFVQTNPEISATFHRRDEKNLIIKCFIQQSINLDKLPVLSLSGVSNLVLENCPLYDDKVLTKLYKNFDLKGVSNVTITLMNTGEMFLPATVFEHFNNFTSLTLEANRFVKFSENFFQSMENLTFLHLDVYDIMSLPGNMFDRLKQLKTFEVQNNGGMKNETKSLNFTLKTCMNLKRIRLEGVRWIWRVKSLLAFNYMLETVEIVNNRIESFNENLFLKSNQIESIVMTNNSITRLPARIFETQTYLMTLDLSHNQISRMENDLLSTNRDLESIDLSYNQLHAISR